MCWPFRTTTRTSRGRATRRTCCTWWTSLQRAVDLRSLSTDGFLLLLAGDEDAKKPYQWVPLLHWLSRWVAQHIGKTMASALVRIPESGLPGPSPLSEQQWAGEIKTH